MRGVVRRCRRRLEIPPKLIAHTALPTLLWHSAQIAGGAAAMSVFGGLLIYATIISFTLFFQEDQDF
jgi:hypothetical protein